MGTITKIMSFPVVELYQFLTSLVFILVLFIDLFSFYIPDYTGSFLSCFECKSFIVKADIRQGRKKDMADI